MSIFASRTTKEIPLPFDAPHTVTIQKLPGRHLHRAQQQNLIESAENFRKIGGTEFYKGMRELQTKDPAGTEAALKDPMNGFSRDVLLEKGITAWTYPDAVSAETIGDLDDEAADFLAREILKLSKPSLFQTAQEAEAEQKNG